MKVDAGLVTAGPLSRPRTWKWPVCEETVGSNGRILKRPGFGGISHNGTTWPLRSLVRSLSWQTITHALERPKGSRTTEWD